MDEPARAAQAPEEQWGLLLEGSVLRVQGDERIPRASFGRCRLETASNNTSAIVAPVIPAPATRISVSISRVSADAPKTTGRNGWFGLGNPVWLEVGLRKVRRDTAISYIASAMCALVEIMAHTASYALARASYRACEGLRDGLGCDVLVCEMHGFECSFAALTAHGRCARHIAEPSIESSLEFSDPALH